MSSDRKSSGTGASAKESSSSAKKSLPKAPATKKATATKAPAKKTPAKTASPAKAPGKATPDKKAPAKQAPTPGAPSEQAVKQSKPWKRARKRAEGVLNDPERMRQIAQEASEKAQGRRSGPLSKILDQISALIRLVVAYARGHYRDVSPQAMVTIVGGLIYFVSPVDLIPDVLPGGFVDDAVVLGWVIRTVNEELEAFMEWEVGQES